jgi:hypothetical protein
MDITTGDALICADDIFLKYYGQMCKMRTIIHTHSFEKLIHREKIHIYVYKQWFIANDVKHPIGQLDHFLATHKTQRIFIVLQEAMRKTLQIRGNVEHIENRDLGYPDVECVDPFHNVLTIYTIRLTAHVVGTLVAMSPCLPIETYNDLVVNKKSHAEDDYTLLWKRKESHYVYNGCCCADNLVLAEPANKHTIYAEYVDTTVSLHGKVFISPVGKCVFTNSYYAWRCQTVG